MPAPLTISYVGNFTRPWCTEVHVAASLGSLGHTVIRHQENEVDWRRMPDKVDRDGAHLFLWTRTWPTPNDEVLAALDELRARGVPSCFYHLDRWWGLDREVQIATEPFFRTDLVVSPDGGNDKRWADAGVNHLWLPPGVFHMETTIGRPNLRRYPNRVVFVGSHPYPHAEWEPYRTKVLDTLAKTFKGDFARWPQGRAVRGQDLADLYATAEVVVGDSCLIGAPSRYWSDRVPETVGRGAYLVHPEVDGMEDWYEDGVHLATYPVGDMGALVDEVRWGLDNLDERQQIARQGQELVAGRDTYVHRLATVIDHIEATLLPSGWREPPVSRAPRALSAPSPAGVAGSGRDVVRVRSPHLRGVTATFELAEGHSDRTAVEEVWTRDDYRLGQMGVRDLAGKVVVDIGANVGAFSVLAAKLRARAVFAYEPHPDNWLALLANLHSNGSPSVQPTNAAVGAEHGTMTLAGGGGGAHAAPAWGDGVDVAVVAINDVLDTALAAGPVGLVKIDCEGGEYPIIAAADPGLLAQVERIAMEFHGPVMPHLSHLDGAADFAPMVAKLAELGRVETFGRPSTGGLLYWSRY